MSSIVNYCNLISFYMIESNCLNNVNYLQYNPNMALWYLHFLYSGVICVLQAFTIYKWKSISKLKHF